MDGRSTRAKSALVHRGRRIPCVYIDTKVTVNLVSMYTRSLALPKSSFFLFGPRGTGKSTWLRENLENPFAIDLLSPATVIRYEREPARFRSEVLAQAKSRWIVVDEVQ